VNIRVVLIRNSSILLNLKSGELRRHLQDKCEMYASKRCQICKYSLSEANNR